MERRRRSPHAAARARALRLPPALEPVSATIIVALGTTALLHLALQMTGSFF
jgi:hypothetical protein